MLKTQTTLVRIIVTLSEFIQNLLSYHVYRQNDMHA